MPSVGSDCSITGPVGVGVGVEVTVGVGEADGAADTDEHPTSTPTHTPPTSSATVRFISPHPPRHDDRTTPEIGAHGALATLTAPPDGRAGFAPPTVRSGSGDCFGFGDI